MKLEAPEIESIDHLIQILNGKEEILSEAHKKETSIDFERELANFWVFRDTMLENAEDFLQYYVPNLPAMHGIIERIDEAIKVSEGICLSRRNLYTIESYRLAEEDAYKSRYLLEYIYFLRKFDALINRYMEYALGYANSYAVPADAGLVNALPQNQQKHLPEKNGINYLPEEVQTSEDPEVRLAAWYELLRREPIEKKIYRITVFKRANDIKGGIRKFVNSLNDTDLYIFFGELIDTAPRNVIGNVNESPDKRYTWHLHKERADVFLKKMLMKMGIIAD